MSCGDPSNFKQNDLIAGPGMLISSNHIGSNWIQLDLPNNSDFKKMQERMDAIERRLAILEPNETLQAKYPALQEAYDHYKLIEKIVEGKTGNDT